MRRAALTDLAGIDAERFNVLRRRDQLPFTGRSESDGGWQAFSLEDAFKLHVMLVLMEAHGLGPQEAKGIMRTPLPGLRDAAKAKDDLWFGEMTFTTAEGDLGFAPVFGAMGELAQRLIGRRVRRAILVNISTAARTIVARAEDMGIAD